MPEQRVGTCSICGGSVVGHRGAWMSVDPPPPDRCTGCGAVAQTGVIQMVFHGEGLRPILTLHADGRIEVTGTPNDAARAFLDAVEAHGFVTPRSRLAVLEAENEWMRLDTERLNWLARQAAAVMASTRIEGEPSSTHVRIVPVSNDRDACWFETYGTGWSGAHVGQTLRAAIDAARAALSTPSPTEP